MQCWTQTPYYSGTVLEWANFIIAVLLKCREKYLHLEGSVVHHLNFSVKEHQRSCFDFTIIKFAHSKTVPILSRESVPFVFYCSHVNSITFWLQLLLISYGMVYQIIILLLSIRKSSLIFISHVVSMGANLECLNGFRVKTILLFCLTYESTCVLGIKLYKSPTL